MTKEITKAIILQDIQNKFALREFDPAPFLFDETVVPVYDITRHLTKLDNRNNTVSVTSATSFEFFQVPDNERWSLHRYLVIFMTGTYTVAGLLIGRPTSSDYMYLDLTAAQSVSYLNDLPKDAILDPGDRLYINVDGYTATGDLRLIIELTVETIR